MLYTPHFLVGAAILKLVPDPRIGIPLAVLTHLAMDYIPHNDLDVQPGITFKALWNNKKQRNYVLGILSIDWTLMGIAFLWLLFAKQNYWLIAGGFAGIFPDVAEQSLMLINIPLPGWFAKMQWVVSAKYGFISYPIVCAIALYIIGK
jgi:hypothetical protein